MLGIAIFTMCRHAHTSVQSHQMKQKTKLQNIAYVSSFFFALLSFVYFSYFTRTFVLLTQPTKPIINLATLEGYKAELT